MSQRPLPLLSHWLLQLFLPLWILALMTIETVLDPSPCRTMDTFVVFSFFGLFQIFGVLPMVKTHGISGSSLALIFAGLLTPLFLCTMLHHNGRNPPGDEWEEVVFPSVFMIWSGAFSCGLLIWSGVVHYGIKLRWAVLISLTLVVLAFTISCAQQAFLSGLVCVYSLPFLVPALKEHLEHGKAPP